MSQIQSAYDRASFGLAEVILAFWIAGIDAGQEEALERMETDGLLDESDLTTIAVILSGFLGAALSQAVASRLLGHVRLVYPAAIEEVLGLDLDYALGATDTAAIGWLSEHHLYWVRTHYTRQVQERLLKVGQEAIRERLARRDAGQLFAKAFPELREQPARYWEGLANHITTRARAFGNVAALEKAGVTEYEIAAVMDGRTSEVCRHMNGKRFKTADAVALRSRLMAAESPEQVKQIAPWFTYEQIRSDSPATLAQKGMVLPPFHFNCRTRIRIVL